MLERPPAEVPLRRGPVPLGELVADAAGAHRLACQAAGVALEVHLPPGLPTLDADGSRLLRLLGNLLDNACRHTPPGGTIRVEAARAGERHVTVTVSDTGPGIPEEALEDIFERYYRGVDARTRGAGGTGLGLAIARAIARAHGGTLHAASAPGQGSTFTLTLPIGDVAA